jgi:hypothetical protein
MLLVAMVVAMAVSKTITDSECITGISFVLVAGHDLTHRWRDEIEKGKAVRPAY